MNVAFLMGPVVGAVIGGITNSIAIKMLFRPINPVKIGQVTLPFTPGVIPKERERIASKVGEVISHELLNEDVLRSWLLKEEVYQQIERSIDYYFEECEANESTVKEMLEKMVGKERGMYYVCEAEEQITSKLYEKMLGLEISKIIVNKIVESYKNGSFGNLLGPMSFFVNENLVESLAQKIEPVIAKFIEEEGEDMIRKAVEEESHAMMETPIKDLAFKAQRYQELLKKSMIHLYEKMITKHLGRILKTLDIAQIVENRVLEMDMLEMEKIILSIMKKELSAIVWFGVLLGAILGCVTSLL